ncbi:MAG: hypothetical protein EON59_13130 [Alphaproteobacteria bacterium]|nr:MAG: hypothetical protein EON59_13130 [Alphaproteobacteria bacterium]
MLPQGFEWRPYIEGEPALYLLDTQLAYVTHTQGGTWRIGFVAKGTPHYRFMGSQEAAQRFVEAWAVKWEAEVRRLVGSKARSEKWNPPSPEESRLAASRDLARRKRHRKNWFKQA